MEKKREKGREIRGKRVERRREREGKEK
jgi:hypothetical protein